ncbi:MAG: HD family phosphohydrolase [Deltaproteobacteria bacterium]
MKNPILPGHLSEAVSLTKARLIKKAGFIIGTAALFSLSAVLALNMSVPVLLVCLVLYLKYLHADLNLKPYRLLNLALLFLIVIAAGFSVIGSGWDLSLVPFCVAPMLAVILFNDLVIALILTVGCAVTVSSIWVRPSEMAMIFMVSGLVSAMLVSGARKRTTIVNAGIIVGAIQALTLFFLRSMDPAQAPQCFFIFLNGAACGIVVTGILPVFEFLFGTITNIKLLEMADFNHPALNRLMLEAPGTYHHSLIVGNLSEAASRAVGANSLLSRIGAYYHDIGKLEKPEYFSENQGLKDNVHETLAPNMSKLVIMNHVKEGIELAKKYNLNPRIVDFIRQHHGTSLVYYFYRKALENGQEQQEVNEEVFRYPGPKASTKEAAIVLLADSVEAATRTLRDPSPQKIEELVHKIINNKFIDGQLDECDLTLKDLEKIAQVFGHILGGIYHSRVHYPEEKNAAKG